MKLRIDRRLQLWAVAALLLAPAVPIPAAAQVPSAAEVLSEHGFSPKEHQKVLGGEFITKTLESTSPSEA